MWEELPEPLASVKGNVLWSAVCIVITSIASAYSTSKAFGKSVVVAAYLTVAVVSAGFLVGAFVSFFRSVNIRATLRGMCSILLSDCAYLSKTYKRLDYENRQRVRNPLSPASIRDFDAEWHFIAAELYSSKNNFNFLKLKVQGVWIAAGLKSEPAVLRLREGTVMLYVITALDDLETKIRELMRSGRLAEK